LDWGKNNLKGKSPANKPSLPLNWKELTLPMWNLSFERGLRNEEINGGKEGKHNLPNKRCPGNSKRIKGRK